MTTIDPETILNAVYKGIKDKGEWKERFLELFGPAVNYASKEDIKAILTEIKNLREDFNKRSEAVDKRFEELIDNMNKGFEAVDKRFEAADRRFEELIDNMNKRFEAVDKRFEAADRRFEELIDNMNKRFEESDKRYEKLREDMNKRFEESDKRYEKLREDMNKRFEENDRRFNQLVEEMRRGFDLVFSEINRFSSRFGKRAEAAARRLTKELLKAEGLEESKIENIVLEDEDGEIFFPGFTTDIDLYYHNSESWLLEYKVTCTVDNVMHFARVCDLAAIEGINAKRRIILTLRLKPGVKEMASKLGIEIWHTTAEKPKKLEKKK